MWNTDAERECLSNPAGRGYIGTVNITASGKPCLSWIEAPTEFSYALPDETTRDALNYCRYIPKQQWTGTSCVVRTKSGFHLERCSIPYCGGTETVLLSYFEDCLLRHICIISVFHQRPHTRPIRYQHKCINVSLRIHDIYIDMRPANCK